MNIDIATGLPELPEGYYWEVKRGWRSYHTENGPVTVTAVEVNINKRIVTTGRYLWGKKWEVIYTPTYLGRAVMSGDLAKDEQFITPADILRTAQDAYQGFVAKRASEERIKSTEALYGAYPPKRLEI